MRHSSSEVQVASIKNIAFMAHVDAGKTTLTERILFETGLTRAMGSVDEGTARTDSLAVERERGISVRAALISFEAGGNVINLIDTPGHTDFFSQVERAFFAIDAAVILVSAVDGVQSGTETIIETARENKIPVVFFVNKCDRDTARQAETASEIKCSCPGAFIYPQDDFETAAMYDDGIMDSYINESAPDKKNIETCLMKKIGAGEICPILFGSAATGKGVAELIEAVCVLLPSADEKKPASDSVPPSGIIFSVSHDRQFGRGAYVRLYAGNLKVKDPVEVNGSICKVSMIKKQTNGKWSDAGTLFSGEIGLVYGFNDCITGNIFGGRDNLPARALAGFVKKALLTAQVRTDSAENNDALKNALEQLAAEDPALELEWARESGVLQLNIMGFVQMETLPALIEERFGLKAIFDEPEVIYKETIAKRAEGFDAYTMPKPSWAILKFDIKPAPHGSGVSYRCTAAANRLRYRYREQVAQSILPSLKQGLYGWEVTDLDINLVDGEDHPIHTHPLDFTIATPLALMNALVNGGAVLLEPILEIRFVADPKYIGRVISDVNKMRGTVTEQKFSGSQTVLFAHVPLASSMEYSATFASLTSGTGVMTQRLHGYRECPAELGKARQRRGVDPRDRAKYILAARHAMSGTVFD